MKQVFSIISIISIVLFCTVCASKPDPTPPPDQTPDDPTKPVPVSGQYEQGHFRSYPTEGNLVVIGMGAKQSTETKSIEDARLDAARKVAIYVGGVKGNASSGSNVTGNKIDSTWEVFSEIVPVNPDIDQYKSRLKYDPADVFIKDKDVVVIFTYPLSSAPSISIPSGSVNGKPEWVAKRENYKIPGFITGIGHSGPKSRLRDTVRSSYESAVISLIDQIEGPQITANDSSISGGAGGGSTSGHTSVTNGELTKFLVLETWRDSDGTVLTLAIVPEPKQQQ